VALLPGIALLLAGIQNEGFGTAELQKRGRGEPIVVGP
jgi:hypothetical protein